MAGGGVVWGPDRDQDYVQWLKQQVFGNHLILEHLVPAVHTEDLAAFRMVCRAWYMASLERFGQEATINVHGFIRPFDGSSEKVTGSCKPKDNVPIPKVTLQELGAELEAGSKVFGLEKPLSFQKYKIRYGSLVENYLYEEPERPELIIERDPHYCFAPFWKSFGPKIQHLTIEHCFVSRYLLTRIMLPVEYQDHLLPALESLELKDIELINVVVNGYTRHQLWPTLLPASPLYRRVPTTRLTIRSYLSRVFRRDVLRYWGQLKEIHLETMHCWAMKRDYERMVQPEVPISTSGFYDAPVPFLPQDRSYAGLVSLNFPNLEYLSLHLEPDVSDHSIQLVLETYADRLKSLKLFRYPFAISAPSRNFPFTSLSLFQLTRLELAGNVSANLDFLLRMPSLRTLLIDQLCFGKVRCVKFEEDRDPPGHGIILWDYPPSVYMETRWRKCLDLPNLTDYYAPFRGDLVKASKLLLERSTPFLHRNLTHLEVDTEWDVEALSTLAQWMPGLTTLKTVLNNATLRSVCQHWPSLEHLKLLFGSLVDDHGVLGMADCSVHIGTSCAGNDMGCPYLINMTSLRHFELENLCHHPKLTDLSAQRVFLQLPKLSALIICSAQMTKHAIEALEWNISHLRIGSHLTQNERLSCCKLAWFLGKIGRLD